MALQICFYNSKAVVQEQNMHEVSSGGLSSFSLINMVIAHLQAEGYSLSPDGRLASQGVPDFGNLLWGFLMRFGDVFDYCDQAISIQQVTLEEVTQQSHRKIGPCGSQGDLAFARERIANHT